MPTVAPQARQAAEGSPASDTQPLSQESLSNRTEASSLRKFAGIAALSMALTNSERVDAQSQITPTPPPGHAAYVNVQTPDGKTMLVPVVSNIPQGYVVAPGAQLPTYGAPQAPIQQGNLPVYGIPQNPGVVGSTPQMAPSQPQGQPFASSPGVGAPTIPMAPGSPGVVPQGGLTIVSPGVQGVAPVAQAMPQQSVSVAAPVLTGPGLSSTLPTSVAQAQMDYNAARIRANSRGNPELDQARLNLEAARLAEQQQIRAAREAERQAIMAQREQMRYNADAQRYHYRRAQDIGWFADLVLPSSVPGPWVQPVPPRVPR